MLRVVPPFVVAVGSPENVPESKIPVMQNKFPCIPLFCIEDSNAMLVVPHTATSSFGARVKSYPLYDG